MARKSNRQRKLERKAKNDAKRRELRKQDAAAAAESASAEGSLEAAEELLARGEHAEAVELLEESARRYPKNLDILTTLADAHRLAGDPWSYQACCARLTLAAPDQPTFWFALASAALGNGQLATAVRAFTHVATAWPDHPESVRALDVQQRLRAFLASEGRRYGLDEDGGFGVLLLHDEVTMQLQLGQFDETCEAAGRLIALCPSFVPALNNRGEAHFRSSRYAEAIADSRQGLQIDETNYHALANLTRYLYLSGRFDEARTFAAALMACNTDAADALLKKAETFAFLGDWETVREVVEQGRNSWAEAGERPALATHLAGVALANLGDLKGARKYWRQAASESGGGEWANENLVDSKRPAGQRHGPWAFPLQQWAPRRVLDAVAAAAREGSGKRDSSRSAQRLFDRHPQLELLAEPMLQRSDPAACELVVRLAGWAERPGLLETVKKFALGRRGSDESRMTALMMLSEKGYVAGQVDVWREGAVSSVALFSQEIYCEPSGKLPQEVRDLMAAAHDSINDGRGAEAERTLDQVLRLRPDDLSAQFNRAVAIHMQGRKDDALEIIRRLHRDQPDYVFARTHLAHECVAAGDLDGARSLLAPIAQQKRLHQSEYAAWCSANIDLALTAGDFKAARKLLDAWERIDPDDHRIAIWKKRIRGRRGLLARLSALVRKAPGDEE